MIFSSGLLILTLTSAPFDDDEEPPVKVEAIELMSSADDSLAVALT